MERKEAAGIVRQEAERQRKLAKVSGMAGDKIRCGEHMEIAGALEMLLLEQGVDI